MAGDPPVFMPWSDAFGYMPWLADHQEPLGKPFEKVLYENLWDLYARDDRPALWFWDEAA